MSVCVNAIKLSGGNFSEIFGGFEKEVMLELVPGWMYGLEDLRWLWAMMGSILIGLSGVLPLVIFPIDETSNLKQGDSANTLKTLLSFAVGGLLGDVFLHSLPEIWTSEAIKNGGVSPMYNGLLILAGLMFFVITEKLFSVISRVSEEMEEDTQEYSTEKTNNNIKGYHSLQNKTDGAAVPNGNSKRHISGYLNLFANSIDNFTHGLSVGGAFLISHRLGCLTTFAILMHEIPHEVGDFAILLKSGFTRWDATKGQLITASIGIVGALAAVFCGGASNSIEARTSWILPLTSGTFLHIALVTVLPDLLKEEDPKESFKQMCALILGISITGFVGTVME